MDHVAHATADDHEEVADVVDVDRDELRRAALVAYHEALHDPDIASSDPLVRARALVALDDTKAVYASLGGRPGSRFSARHAPEFAQARQLLVDEGELDADALDEGFAAQYAPDLSDDTGTQKEPAS